MTGHISPLLFLSILMSISQISTLEKHWWKSNSWNDPLNWEPPRLPCPNDKIVLKQDVIYIEKNITIKSALALPTNGEMIFGSDSSITFDAGKSLSMSRKKRSVASQSSCSSNGVDMKFVGQQMKNWFNPLNWHIYTNGKKDDYLTKAAPYIERVPCVHDSVSFPNGGAFEVNIAENIVVKDVKVNGKTYSKNRLLQAYLATKEGKSRFKFMNIASSLKVDSSIDCVNTTCKCRRENIATDICSTFKCPATCTKKVKPLNDCCYHCGALINYKHDHTFDLNKCWKNLRGHLEKDNKFTGVRIYLYVVESRNINTQILLTEDGDGNSAESASEAIFRYLKGANGCGDPKQIKKEKIKQEEEDGGMGSSGKMILAVVLVIFFLAIILFAGIWYWKRSNPIIERKRFDNENDFTEFPGVDDIETNFTSTTGGLPGTTQFANPLYETQEFDGDGNKSEVASPEFSIPIEYISKKIDNKDEICVRFDNKNEDPRYVEAGPPTKGATADGVSNPSYNLGSWEKFDNDEPNPYSDPGNFNPLYEVIMKDYPEKIAPDETEDDLNSTGETDSIRMKLELKLNVTSESEEERSVSPRSPDRQGEFEKGDGGSWEKFDDETLEKEDGFEIPSVEDVEGGNVYSVVDKSFGETF